MEEVTNEAIEEKIVEAAVMFERLYGYLPAAYPWSSWISYQEDHVWRSVRREQKRRGYERRGYEAIDARDPSLPCLFSERVNEMLKQCTDEELGLILKQREEIYRVRFGPKDEQ